MTTRPATIETSPDRPAPVTEVELAALKRDRAMLEQMTAQAKALARNLEEREADLVGRIEGGAEVLGAVQPTVKIASRKNVSWVTAFGRLARRLGLDDKAEISAVKAEAPVTFYKELLIP